MSRLHFLAASMLAVSSSAVFAEGIGDLPDRPIARHRRPSPDFWPQGESRSGDRVFSDREMQEMPERLQSKLLRVLEERHFRRVGGTRNLDLSARVIAMTNRDLAKLAREGRFREDLYYRLQVVPIHVPPLRARPEDIPVLARYFVREIATGAEAPVLAPDAIAALSAHPWRGNVRELRNVIERALAFSPAPEVIQAKHLRLNG